MTERTCSVEGCNELHDARGLCRCHYKRAMRAGTLPPLPEKLTGPAGFWARTRPERGCLIWTGAISSGGYGQVQWDRQQMTAHRVAFFLRMGRWPFPGMQVRHMCSNRACVLHTLEGTPHQNALDRYASGTMRHAQKTHCKNGHEFTPENTRVVETPWGTRRRHCRECTRARKRERYARQKAQR